MGPTVLLLAAAMAAMAPQRDAAAHARELYNLHQYDEAIKAADDARRLAGSSDVAGLILGRAYLERYRGAGDVMDLTQARDALKRVDSSKLSARDSIDLVIGLGELLYFDGQYGAAAEFFDVALAAPGRVEPGARDGLIDWWADSLDRQAPAGSSRETYARMLRRVEEETQRDARSTAASYWLVVAARGVGDLDRAWDAAVAAWVKAPRGIARAVELRADLDRYVNQVLIPERAKRAVPAEEAARTTSLHAEWDALKEQWREP